MAHLAAPFADGEGGCADGVLKQGAFGLREAIDAHFDALRQMLQDGRQRPCAHCLHPRRGFYLVKPK